MAEIQITNEDLEYIKNTNPTAYNNHIVNNGTSNSGTVPADYSSRASDRFGNRSKDIYEGYTYNGTSFTYEQLFSQLIEAGYSDYDAVNLLNNGTPEEVTSAINEAFKTIDNNKTVDTNKRNSVVQGNNAFMKTINANKNKSSMSGNSYSSALASSSNNNNLNEVVNNQTSQNQSQNTSYSPYSGSWQDVAQSQNQYNDYYGITSGLHVGPMAKGVANIGKGFATYGNAFGNYLADTAKKNNVKDYSGTI